jgi:hypothetical protein
MSTDLVAGLNGYVRRQELREKLKDVEPLFVKVGDQGVATIRNHYSEVTVELPGGRVIYLPYEDAVYVGLAIIEMAGIIEEKLK